MAPPIRLDPTGVCKPVTVCRAALLVAAACFGATAAIAAQDPAVPQAEVQESMAQMLRSDALRHEQGNGVDRDLGFAAVLYCKAARLGDAEAQFHLGWMYAYGRGVERNDAWAAYMFQAATDQGIPQGPQMLRLIGSPLPQMPDCMRPPAPVPPEVDEAAQRVELEAAAAAARASALLVAAPKAIVKLVMSLAPEYKVPPTLALAIIQAESNFDSAALSPKNAMGLMQLIPETAERFSVKNPYDPKQNIRGGLAYLRWLLAYFEGDPALVAAAYNAGERTVERYLGVPPYDETRAYVRRIVAAVGVAAQPFDPKAAQPSPRLRLIREPRSAVN